MTRLVSYRFRLYPSATQVDRMIAWQSALRFLWNLANEQRLVGLGRPRSERRYVSRFAQDREMTELRAFLPWLADVPRGVCEAILARLDNAWGRCFDRLGQEPRWKRKDVDHPSITQGHSRDWRIADTSLVFPKLGPIRMVAHRPVSGRQRTCSIVRDGDQWFASLLYEQDVAAPAPRLEPAVGIDRGVIAVTADSDGRLTTNPRFFQASMRRLARAQRIVARRQKGSANREKAKLRVARLHRKVRRQREHFLHSLSATYSKSHGTVVVENLNVQGMVRSNLARSILDAGWGRFVEMLKYKLDWNGGRLIEVPAAYSSQTCSTCSHVDAKSRVTQAAFRCTSCGHTENADTNAAKVILARSNRSGLPMEGTAPKATRRSGKRRLSAAEAVSS